MGLAILCSGRELRADVRCAPAAKGDVAAEEVRSRCLLEVGQKQSESGDTKAAKASLDEALSLRATPEIAAVLGKVEASQGQHVEAAGHLDYAFRHAPAGSNAPWMAGLPELLAEEKNHVVLVHAEASLAGARITINGRDVGTAPLAGDVFVEPGHVVVRATADGHAPAEAVAEAPPGSRIDAKLKLRPLPRAKLPVWPGLVLGGVGLAGIGVGIAGMSAAGAASADHHDGRARGFRAMGITGFVVGGAAVVGAVIYVFAPFASSKAAARSTVWLEPSLGPTSGLWLSGRF